MCGVSRSQAACRRLFSNLIACTLSCRNNTISDAVSIRGAFEVASFGLSEAVEAVAELFLPPVFKFVAMFFSDRLNQRRLGGNLSGVGAAGQRNNSRNIASVCRNLRAQIGDGAALANKIINDQVCSRRLHLAIE